MPSGIPDPTTWPISVTIGVFAAMAILIAFLGWRLVAVADTLADATGLGEAVFGALFLGASTSLPGITTSVVAAWADRPQLAVSNALGGIAAQTMFLAIADIAYRKANLEHAAASAANITQTALLVILLAGLLVTPFTPAVTVWAVHPATPILFGAYILGIRMVHTAHAEPMWRPRETLLTRKDTEADTEEGEAPADMRGLWIRFAVLAVIVAAAGYVLTRAAVAIADRTGLSETVVGGLFTAISTSLPELVAAVAAVRQGALSLAVGDVIGGNVFDTLFVGAADVAYRAGSIYHVITGHQSFLVALTVLLTSILLLGLAHRQERGFGTIGFESLLILVLYIAGFVMLTLG